MDSLETIIESCENLHKEIDSCIRDLVSAKLNDCKDFEAMCLSKMESLMCVTTIKLYNKLS